MIAIIIFIIVGIILFYAGYWLAKFEQKIDNIFKDSMKDLNL